MRFIIVNYELDNYELRMIQLRTALALNEVNYE